MLAAAVASCTKETTPERINIQHPDQQSPILRDNAYYQNLRAYKQTKHKLAFGWYGSWTAVGASYQSRLDQRPRLDGHHLDLEPVAHAHAPANGR